MIIMVAMVVMEFAFHATHANRITHLFIAVFCNFL